MAVFLNGDELYKGQVIGIDSRYWLDGMLEEWAVVWDPESNCTKRISFGYYGIDGTNLAGGRAEVDATEDTKRSVRKALKEEAIVDFCKSVQDYKKTIRKESKVEVIRGRKVPKGTILRVFWVGEQETYRSKQYSWMHETELVAGCYDDKGNKVWVKAEYLKPIDKIKSPNAKERKKFINSYVSKRAKEMGV